MYKDQHKWIQLMLMLVDGMITIFAFILAGMLRYRNLAEFFRTVNLSELVIVAAFSSLLAFVITKMFKEFFKRGYLMELQRVMLYSLSVMLFVSLYSFSTKNQMALSRLTLLYYFIFNIFMMYVIHIGIKLFSNSRARGKYGWKMLVITDADNANTACRNILKSEMKNRVIGIMLWDKPAEDFSLMEGFSLIDTEIGYMDYITHNAVDEVLLSIPEDIYQSDKLQSLLADIIETGAVLSLKVDLPIKDESRDRPYVSRLTKIGDSYVLSFANREYDYAMIVLKRLMDIVGSIIGLLIMIVLGPFLALAIFIESPGPLFFKQQRIGRNGRIFTMLKFRSMYADAEKRKAALLKENKMQGPLFKMDNDPRITHVGKFIRKTSLDELPQFLNVFKGDMSIVGIRPPTFDEYRQYTSAQKRRLSFRPGITGLWQVSGRNDITDFNDVMKMDLQYIQEWSIYLDIKLILKTIIVVLRRKGAE